MAVPEGPDDALTEDHYRRAWAEIDAARAKLALPKAGARPAFRWPLRAARGYSDPGFARVSSYVDHDPAFPNAVRDYTCGARSYDRDTGYNHQGIDISIFPDNWNVMAARQVEVVAAAPGVILFRADGNPDQSCSFNTSDWNAVYVQHDDGSIAMYGHLKAGSVTPKTVGLRVAVGEYLGTIGSSGNSTGPHLHFEVYDADRKLIDPFQGACNTKNAESWWESQPPYRVTSVSRVFTSFAAPTFPVCGTAGVLQDPGTMKQRSTFAPGDTVYFVVALRDWLPGEAPRLIVRRPDGSVWRDHLHGAPAEFVSGAYFWLAYTLEASAPAGTWMMEGEIAGTKAQFSFTVTAGAVPIPNYTDLWWNPAEPGWGVNLNHQGDSLFATWFTYDTDGRGMWLVMSDAARQGDGSYAGEIYRTTGVPLQEIDGRPAANLPPPSVGRGAFRFTSGARGDFQYLVNGVSQAKAIERQVFGATAQCVFTKGSRASLTNYQDLWWNSTEPGWGINLAHQGDVIFATWFTYAQGGRGQWLVASDARRQPTGEYSGRLYRTTGVAFDRIAGSAIAGAPLDVGEVTLTFSDGERGRLDYTVDGVRQSKAIARQVFGTATPLCR